MVTKGLEKEMATHSSVIAWELPWTEDLVGYSPWGHKEWTQLSDKHTHEGNSRVEEEIN